MNDGENRILNFSIFEYFDLYYKKHEYKKLDIVITPNQIAYLIGNVMDRYGKIIMLSQTLFPKRNYNYNNYYEGGIWIFLWVMI